MTRGRVALALVLAAAVAAFFALGFGRYVSLDAFQARRAAIDALVAAHPVGAAAAFFAVYVAITALSLPGAALMTLVAGAMFGLLEATLIVSFASSIGATLAFLAARYVLRDWVQSRFGEKLARVNRGIAREGGFYLFALRLMPLFPFFLVNLAMGVTPIRTRTFYAVSQAGMLPGTIAYVYAGTQLAALRLSAGLVVAFVILGLFPLAAKRALEALAARRRYARWPRPRRFERNVVVIGAGSAGLVAAYIAAAVKAKVTLVERDRMGGDCLNTGCVPSKALIRTTRLLDRMRRASDYGIRATAPEIDFSQVMERVRAVVRAVEPHDSVARYTALGVECVHGEARIATPWSVEVALAGGGTRTITTRNVIIAAGARPLVPPIPGLAEARPLTSDTVWDLRALPPRLVVLGGGPIGCELAQCFARLGSHVTLVEMAPRLLAREDEEFSAMVAERFTAEGIAVLAGHRAREVRRTGDAKLVALEGDGGGREIACDAILCALGRVANTTGYGLEALGVPIAAGGTVEVDEYLRAGYPNIFACGDVAGPYQFTHTASHTAWYAAVNALFGRLRRFRVDYSVVPWATFTDPEVARVGLNEQEARARNIAYEVATFDLAELDRAIADGEASGRVKVLTRPGSDRILGATIAGEHAGDILVEFVTAMRHGFGLKRILGTIHVYPTLAEANKAVAGAWKRAHATRGQLAFASRFHAWTRGETGWAAVLAGALSLADRRAPVPDAAAREPHA